MKWLELKASDQPATQNGNFGTGATKSQKTRSITFHRKTYFINFKYMFTILCLGLKAFLLTSHQVKHATQMSQSKCKIYNVKLNAIFKNMNFEILVDYILYGFKIWSKLFSINKWTLNIIPWSLFGFHFIIFRISSQADVKLPQYVTGYVDLMFCSYYWQ